MKTTCPHCSQRISIDPDTLAELQGQEHFQCPACGGDVPVPPATNTMPLAPPRTEGDSDSNPPAPAASPSNHSGLHRNLLILGSAALLVLGGLAFFIASRQQVDSKTSISNVKNEIINNSFFQNLIASGVTTMKDLEAVGMIRPYRDGFIGISAQPMDWQEANGLAVRTGSRILETDQAWTPSGQSIVSWLKSEFHQYASFPLWLSKEGSPATNRDAQVVPDIAASGNKAVVLYWPSPAAAETEKVEAIEIVSQLGGKVIRDPNVKGNPIVELDLSNTQLSDAGLARISKLRGVKKLNLFCCYQVGDAGLRSIGKMTDLEWLNLWGCHGITDVGFQYLTNLKKLYYLGTWYTGAANIDGSGLAHLAKLKGLRVLGLSFLHRIEPGHLRHIAALEALENLYLDDCWEIGDESIDWIVGLKNLKELGARATRISNDGLMRLGAMQNLKSLILTRALSNEDASKMEKDMGPGYLNTRSGYKRPNFTESGVKQLQDSRPDLVIRRD